jgi:hypothetical protein
MSETADHVNRWLQERKRPAPVYPCPPYSGKA